MSFLPLEKQSLGPEFKRGYCPALDGLRGVSILLVLEHHAPWHMARMDFLPGGYIGVDVFFVLSGFLITTLLVQEWNQSKAISLGKFYFRGVLRLLPPSLLLVIILTGLYALLSTNHCFSDIEVKPHAMSETRLCLAPDNTFDSAEEIEQVFQLFARYEQEGRVTP